MAANPMRVTEGSRLEAVRVTGAGFATGFADCVVFNSGARCSTYDLWQGRLGRSVSSPRIPASPQLGSLRAANRARIAGDCRQQAARSNYFTADELSELLEQYRDTVARCVSVAMREGKIPYQVDRKEIENSLLVELANILRAYRPYPHSALSTYVWGVLNRRIGDVIKRELSPVTVSLDQEYPEGGKALGGRVPAAGGSDDSEGGGGWCAPPRSTPVWLWQKREDLKLSVRMAERRLESSERRVFDLYHRDDLSQKEIAHNCGMSQAWVHGVLARAEAKMRHFLTPCDNFQSGSC